MARARGLLEPPSRRERPGTAFPAPGRPLHPVAARGIRGPRGRRCACTGQGPRDAPGAGGAGQPIASAARHHRHRRAGDRAHLSRQVERAVCGQGVPAPVPVSQGGRFHRPEPGRGRAVLGLIPGRLRAVPAERGELGPDRPADPRPVGRGAAVDDRRRSARQRADPRRDRADSDARGQKPGKSVPRLRQPGAPRVAGARRRGTRNERERADAERRARARPGRRIRGQPTAEASVRRSARRDRGRRPEVPAGRGRRTRPPRRAHRYRRGCRAGSASNVHQPSQPQIASGAVGRSGGGPAGV